MIEYVYVTPCPLISDQVAMDWNHRLNADTAQNKDLCFSIARSRVTGERHISRKIRPRWWWQANHIHIYSQIPLCPDLLIVPVGMLSDSQLEGMDRDPFFWRAQINRTPKPTDSGFDASS